MNLLAYSRRMAESVENVAKTDPGVTKDPIASEI
jgi:hypothetical protein